jgi:hypothetical protein
MPDITQFAREYTSKKEAEEAAKPKGKFTHDELLTALMWVWDSFDRSGMTMIAVFDTAKQIMKQEDLSGDGIDVAVRRLEWESGGKPILDAFLEHYNLSYKLSDDGKLAVYDHFGVPIRVHVLEEHECLSNYDTIVYRMEHFKIPNPYSKFEEIYGKIEIIPMPKLETIVKDFTEGFNG